MKWLVFAYSLPSKSRSSPRVTLWRRLRRVGAISVKTGVYILPATDECIEAFQWLAQEVQQAKGDTFIAEYQNKSWVTRPRPFVDRLACIWLIRKFIDPHAVIRYSLQPAADEITFDMKEAEFGHQGNLCSFETMMLRFGLVEPGVKAIAQIVHELDLKDGAYISPEASGVETIIKGWLLASFSDTELESLGIKLFEGLYLAFSEALDR
jgi:hypothetical protein